MGNSEPLNGISVSRSLFNVNHKNELNGYSRLSIITYGDGRLNDRHRTLQRRPSLELYDRHSPKLQPFPMLQKFQSHKRSHSESSIFRNRLCRTATDDCVNSKLNSGWFKMKLDKFFKKFSNNCRQNKSNSNNNQCLKISDDQLGENWKEKLELWAESLRQAIKVVNREEQLRLYVQNLQSENAQLKIQLKNVASTCNDLNVKCTSYAKEIQEAKNRRGDTHHLYCHHCATNKHLDITKNSSLCHLMDLDNLTSELKAMLSCDQCCVTCRTIAGQLLKRLKF